MFRSKKIHLLHMGRSIREANDISNMLRDSFPKASFSNVASLTESSAFFVSSDRPDIILINSDIIDFNDYRAISLAKYISEDIPVIFVSDGDHMSSIKALKFGADNYIMLNKGIMSFKKIITSCLHLCSDRQFAKQYANY